MRSGTQVPSTPEALEMLAQGPVASDRVAPEVTGGCGALPDRCVADLPAAATAKRSERTGVRARTTRSGSRPVLAYSSREPDQSQRSTRWTF